MALIIIAATTLMMNWFQRNCQQILRLNQPHANTHYTFVINFFFTYFFVILFSLFFLKFTHGFHLQLAIFNLRSVISFFFLDFLN